MKMWKDLTLGIFPFWFSDVIKIFDTFSTLIFKCEKIVEVLENLILVISFSSFNGRVFLDMLSVVGVVPMTMEGRSE